MYRTAFARFSLILLALCFSQCNSPNSQVNNEEKANQNIVTDSGKTTAKKENRLYGLPKKPYVIQRNRVQRNEYLGAILRENGVPYPKIDKLIKQAKGIFDVTNIRTGNFYCAFNPEDSTRQGCDYLVYEIDPINYVVFQFKDTVDVYKGRHQVKTKTRKTAAIIEQSLWEALDQQNASPVLVMRMAEIFAWNVNFYRIDKGDRFKVIYEQQYVGDEYVGVGEIKAAYFQHRGEAHYAFPFKQNGEREFYNENGQSLRKTLLQAPLKFSRVTSSYTRRRYHPVMKEYRAHKGTDYGAPTGTPIRSVGDGTVIAARYGKYNGQYVKIRHNSVYATQYLHMSDIADGIHRGAEVEQSQVVGYVGATGLATGPHLCYRFWKNGRQVDPYEQDIPSAEPVKPPYMEAFKQQYKPLKAKLDGISFNQKAKTHLP